MTAEARHELERAVQPDSMRMPVRQIVGFVLAVIGVYTVMLTAFSVFQRSPAGLLANLFAALLTGSCLGGLFFVAMWHDRVALTPDELIVWRLLRPRLVIRGNQIAGIHVRVGRFERSVHVHGAFGSVRLPAPARYWGMSAEHFDADVAALFAWWEPHRPVLPPPQGPPLFYPPPPPPY